MRGWMIVVAVVSLPLGVVAWYRRLDSETQNTVAMLAPMLLYLIVFLMIYDRMVVGRNRHKKR
ncbi:MAG: hypothetical protein NVSMB14_17630 [Isosphaeraceae bacterium]